LRIRLLCQHPEERTGNAPAELSARGCDEVTGYGAETIANEEDHL
jgi:hypothetical protein